jgi:acetyltransferase-like isoleucine patch superfamily enzyme
VLPGSVLSINVPPATVVGGNPAKIVRRDFDNSGLRRSLSHNVDQRMLAVP